MATTFQLNKTYNFNTLAPGILNQYYKVQKVIAIFNSKEAVKHRDIQTLHSNVSKVVTNLPANVSNLTYILFENDTGDQQVLALEYIDQNSIQEVTTFNIRVDIKNANTNDLALIRKYLMELGYTNLEITTFN